MEGLVFDVSGTNGAPGIDGVDLGHTKASLGNRGCRGGDGSPGLPGTPAGDITIQLSTPDATIIPPNVVLAQPADADIMIDVSMFLPTGETKRIEREIKVKGGDSVNYLAVGGNGGRGGNGGNGQVGGTGERGLDATRYRSGTRGGPGGDGGDGGNAGSGGDGARGGQIQIRVSKEDTHLLMLPGMANVSGGLGGEPGIPGRGGDGGTGGKGGSSHTYTEVYNGGTRVAVKFGGSQGPHGNPGSSGARGSPGLNDRNGVFSIVVLEGSTEVNYTAMYDLSLLDVQIAPISDDGIIEPGSRVFVSSIVVTNVGGMSTPTSRAILAYIEPKEPQQPSLEGENWVVSEGLQRFVQLPLALEPEDVAVIPCSSATRGPDGTPVGATNPAGEYLAFRVAPINPVPALSSLTDRHQRGEPFHVISQLIISAQVTPFGWEFPTFFNPKPFDIYYPVQMSSIASLSSLPPGGDTCIRFTIKNVSLKDYGTEGEIGRKVVAKITYDDGDLHHSNASFVPIINETPQNPVVFDPTPNHAGPLWLIPLLSAGDSITLSGRLLISQKSKPYTAANFSIDLLLGEIENPLKLMTIQRRQLSVRVSKVYNKTAGSHTLLMVNNQTTKEEIDAWEDLASLVFGTDNSSGNVDVWDISREGHFDLTRVLSNGSSLCDDWEGSTIVVLDNFFDNPATRTSSESDDDRAFNYLDHDQLVSAVVSHGVHFCVVSPLIETSAAQDQHLTSPRMGINFTYSKAFETFGEILNPFVAELTAFVVYPTSQDFIAAVINVQADGSPIPITFPLFSKKKPPVRKIEIGSADLYTHVEHVILMDQTISFYKATKQAERLQKKLLRKHPTRRYAMSTCRADDIRNLMEGIGFDMPPETRAVIRVRRLLDVSSLTNRITLTAAPASPVDRMAVTQGASTIHTPEFIKSPQNTSAYFQSIPFVRRVSLYAAALSVLDVRTSNGNLTNERWRAETLGESLLADLGCEQAVLRMKKRLHGLTKHSIAKLLPRLSAFCAINLPALPIESAGRRHLLFLLVKLFVYMKCKCSWYEHFLPARRSRQVTKMSNLLIDGLISRVFSSGSGPKVEEQVKAAKATTLKQWKNDVKELRESLSRDGQSTQAISLRGRAFAAVLGNVAGGEIKWCDELAHRATSIAGGICTEFSMIFTPKSFSAGGAYGAETLDPPADAIEGGRVRLGSISHHRETTLVSESGTIRKCSILSRVEANTQHKRDLLSNPSLDLIGESE